MKPILFIGNSYTTRNEGIHVELTDLSRNGGIFTSLVINACKGKYHLLEHWKDQDTKEKFGEHKWDKVVLQEYSGGAIKSRQNFMKYGKKWSARIRKSNPKTKIYLFATWGYKKTTSMTDSTYSQYRKLAEEIDATVVPAGLLFSKLKGRINLYDPDGAHPNHKGTFITACLFYEFLYEKDVRKTAHEDHILSLDEQKFLKEEAHKFKREYEKKND